MQVATAAVLLVLTGAGLTVRSSVDELDRTRQLQATATTARQVTSQLLTSYVDEETGLRGYLITGTGTTLDPYRRAQEVQRAYLAELRRELARLGVATTALDEVTAAHGRWREYATDALAAQAAADPTGATPDPGDLGKGRFDEVRQRVGVLDAQLLSAQAAQDAHALDLQGRLVRLLVGALGLLLATTLAAGALLWWGVSRPLGRLAAASRSVASGDLSARMPAAGLAEVAALAADVGAMRDRLTADLHGVHEAVRALEHGEPAVAALRRALTPVRDGLPGTTVSARLDAAEGVLAGDWFDVLRLDGQRLAVVVGDVAGHGPVSAVFALRLKHSLAAALRVLPGPAAALGRVSLDLAELPDPSDDAGEMFATVFVAVVDTTAGTVRYASAGHPDAFVLSGGREQPEEVDVAGLVDHRERLHPRERRGVVGGPGGVRVTWTSLPSTGPLLSAALAGPGWEEHERPFRVGESLLVHTDGITEARDAEGEEFGSRGVLETAAGVGLGDGTRLLDAIAAGAVLHAGGRSRRDDQTLVLLRRTSAGALPAPADRGRAVRPRSFSRP